MNDNPDPLSLSYILTLGGLAPPALGSALGRTIVQSITSSNNGSIYIVGYTNEDLNGQINNGGGCKMLI